MYQAVDAFHGAEGLESGLVYIRFIIGFVFVQVVALSGTFGC